MDGPQSTNDVTERSRRRRISSILKAPRSPLKDLGSGNEIHQESTLEKRRKSSRRVSFAETIRCVKKKTQDARSLWDDVDCTKLLNENDMDMNSINTMTIAGFFDEKPQKIDITSFLAGLSSQEDSTKNLNSTLESSASKNNDFQHAYEKKGDAKISFSDFLASLKPESESTAHLEGIDKENFFLDFMPPSTSKNGIPNSENIVAINPTQEDTGNMTRFFRDELDLTTCHTSNIKSLIPSSNEEFPNCFAHLGTSGKPVSGIKFSSYEAGQPVDVETAMLSTTSRDKTILFSCDQEDMDMTRSHTVAIDGQALCHGTQNNLNSGVRKSYAPLEKTGQLQEKRALKTALKERTILFACGDDMDMTRSHTVAIDGKALCHETQNNLNAGVRKSYAPLEKTGQLQEKRALKTALKDRTIVFACGDDMDMTRSHTVAIDGQALCHETQNNLNSGVRKSYAPLDKTGQLQDKRALNTALKDKTILFACDDDMDMTRSHTVAIDGQALYQGTVKSNVAHLKPCLRKSYVPSDKTVHLLDDMERTKAGMESFTCKNTFPVIGKQSDASVNPKDKAILFSCTQEDMEMTRSHTVAIDGQALCQETQNRVNSDSRKSYGPLDKTRNLLDTASKDKTVLFACDQDDMDMTRSHTIAIDGQALSQGTHNNQSAILIKSYAHSDKMIHIQNDMDMIKVSGEDFKCNTTVPLVGKMLDSGTVLKDKTILFSCDQDDMDMTRSHTVAINGQALCQETQNELNSYAPFYKTGHLQEITLNSISKDKTDFVSCDQDDMDMTRSHTVAIDGEVLCQRTIHSNATHLKSDIRKSYVPSDKTVRLYDDMEMTKVSMECFTYETTDPVGKQTMSTNAKDRTIIFTCDQEDMDMTRSHTVAIDDQALCQGTQNNQNAGLQKSYAANDKTVHTQDRKTLLNTTSKDNTIFSRDQDIDMSRMHTISIDGQAHGQINHNSLNPVLRKSYALSEKTLNPQDDMERTKLSSEDLNRETTGPPMGKLPISSTGLKDKTIVFSGVQEDMDMTRSHTVVIDRKYFYNATLNNQWSGMTSNLESLSLINKTLAVFEDDMDLTKSNTMVIDGRSNLGSQDDGNLTKSHTVSIENKLSVETGAGGILKSCKTVKRKGMPAFVPQVINVKDKANGAYVEQTTALSRTQDITILFPSEQDEMDMTQAHTAAIENKFWEENKNDQKYNSTKLQPQSTSDKCAVTECDMILTKVDIEKKSAIWLDNPYSSVNKSSAISTYAQDDMDITKSNTVFVNQLLDESCRRGPRSFNVLNRKSASVPRRSCAYDKTLHLDDNMERTNTTGLIAETTLSFETNQSVISRACKDKTVVFACDENDMDVTRSHTVSIENKALGEATKIHRVHVKDEMDISKSHTISINENILKGNALQTQMSQKNVENPSDKIIVFATENDGMDLTSSHTSIIRREKVFPQSIKYCQTRSLADKSMLNYNDMDVTKSQTVRIDCNLVGSTAYQEMADNQMRLQQKDTSQLFMPSISKDHTVKFSIDQGDLELTKCHTVAIESDILGEKGDCYAIDKTVCTNKQEHIKVPKSHTAVLDVMKAIKCPDLKTGRKSNSCFKDNTMFSKDDSNMDITNSNIRATFLTETSQKDKTVLFTCDSDDMDITKSETVAIDNKVMGKNNKTECDLQNRKSIQSSKRFNKTVISSEYSGDMELTQSHTTALETPNIISTKQIALPLTDSASVLLGDHNNLNIAKMHTTVIHSEMFPETKDLETNSKRNSLIKSLGSLLPPSSDTTGLISYIGGLISENDKHVSSEEIVEHSSLNQLPGEIDPNIPENIRTESSKVRSPTGTCTEYQKAVEIASPSCADTQNDRVSHILEDDESVIAQNRGPLKDNFAAKTARLRSKRVSFMLPECNAESYAHPADISEAVVPPVTFSEVAEYEQLPSISSPVLAVMQIEQEGSICGDPKYGLNAYSSVDYKPGEDNLPDVENGNLTQNLNKNECKANVAEVLPPNTVLSSTSAEISHKDKNRRRSIAGIHLRIKSLSQKYSTLPDSQTAPVSYLVEQLPTSALTSEPKAACPEVVKLLMEESSLIAQKQGEKQVETEDHTTTKIEATNKEISLQNRLSIKIFQPKLPQKRRSNFCSIEEPKFSVPETTETDGASVTLFRAMTDENCAPCIDEEMLPDDDQDANGLFNFEVPEGAWEALCEEEALHNNLGPGSQDRRNGQKRARETEECEESQREKKVRNEHVVDAVPATVSVAFKAPEDYHVTEESCLHATKIMEQTNYSSNSSSLDSRGDRMTAELSSQQYSQMDSQLPWDNECEQNVWGKLEDGTITVKEFFKLLKVPVLIQKPRYSELPAKKRTNDEPTLEDIFLDQYIYQPKLQVYDEECHVLYKTIEDLKTCAEIQDKPLMHVNNLLWEALKMCSEAELRCFGVKLKSMKSLYAKKSKVLTHEGKVSMYGKLLQTAKVQYEKMQSRISEVDKLLEETDKCISLLDTETAKLEIECRSSNFGDSDPLLKDLQLEVEHLKFQEDAFVRECSRLEERKQQVLSQLGCLQEEAERLEKNLNINNLTEWDLDMWTEDHAVFTFLYDSIVLTITFGDQIGGSEEFVNKPCRKISDVTFETQLDEDIAPSSSLLVHRLISQYITKKGGFHEKYKTQQNLPELLLDVSLAVSRCRSLGEELEYLMKWGPKYKILRTQVQGTEVKIVFSCSAAFAKFELVMELSESYPTVPLSFTVMKRIGNIGYDKISLVMSRVPVGPSYLKRAVQHIYESLLV
ncbi:outer kinetochore KNL1 complex subunit KNL1 [Discoglossus pictus]